MSTIQGDTGPTGEKGPMGLKGDRGDNGATGIQGPKGDQGPVGGQGELGPTGPAGIQGPQGIQGQTGDQGELGPTGPAGIQGPQGIQGQTGGQGELGPTGPAGIQGPQGIQGQTGDQGELGPTGPAGIQGPQGIQGPTGRQGEIGPTGAVGAVGEEGPRGVEGPTGRQGEIGPTGRQGIPGTAANTGATGPPGDSTIIINLTELSTYSESVQTDGVLNISLPNNSTNFLHNDIPVKHFSPLEYGLNGAVNVLVNYESSQFENELYIGGNFTLTNVTNQRLNYIAVWNGIDLSSLGSGLNGPCSTIAFDSEGNVYAGGSFTTAGGLNTGCIAKWDGANWISINVNNTSSSDNPAVECLSITIDKDDTIYAIIRTKFSNPTLFMYQTNLWTAMAESSPSYYGGLYTCLSDNLNNKLIVGGVFTAIGNLVTNEAVDANSIAIYDISTGIWSALGNGLRNSRGNSLCNKIQVYNLGNIYASGDFDTIDGWNGNIPGFAKWNGTAWSPIFTTF